MSVPASSVPIMDLSPKITEHPSPANDAWKRGFQLHASSGTAMQCDECAALVRQDPGSAQRHRDWHHALKGGGHRP